MSIAKFHLYLVVVLISLSTTQAQSVKPVDLELPKVLFTDPDQFKEEGLDPALMLQIKYLVEATPSGEEITVCVFKFEIKQLADIFLEAQERGVKVRLILNDGKTSEESNEEVYGLFKKDLEDFYFIENDISDKGIIHNKFLLFSRVLTTKGDLNHVVVQTSANFQRKGAKKLQDMMLLSNRRIYYGYIDLWYDIKVLGKADRLDEYDYFESSSEDGKYEASFFPKRKGEEEFGKDNIVKILKAIDNPKKTEIRFAHGKWTENRKDIVEELNKLRKEGARVEVVTNKNVEDEIKDGLKDLKEGVYFLDKSFNMHTKFFLVNDNGRQRVWTGSHNLTNRSLRENFEVLLMIEDPAIYQDYLEYFEKIKELAD
jgi:phosphatidylserine/phosphatidylglycerophosphate/cardiolipin synthase-like enzyme